MPDCTGYGRESFTAQHEVVIDGLNVARDRSFSTDNARCSAGSAVAIALAIEHFRKRNNRVHVILPYWAIDKRSSSKLSESDRLDEYMRSPLKIIHLAPSGADEDDFIVSSTSFGAFTHAFVVDALS